MTRNMIRDGQTRKAAIAPTVGLNDGLQFSYRPMLPLDFQGYEDAIGKFQAQGKPDESVRVIARVLAKHVKEWSEVDEQGKPVAVTVDAWLAMPFPIIKAVYDITAGYKPSDAIEDDAEAEDDRLTRLLEGLPGGVESDQKN